MTNAPASATPTPLLFGRYRPLEQLGEGRLATVFSALDERLQRKVLIHFLRKEFVAQEKLRERFVLEANASAQRSHPALLEVFDSGTVSQRPFMVTEYVAGRPLRQLGMLTTEQALLYFRQVVSAVALCQARDVAAPFVSSNNVLLVDEGRVKLVESWLTPPAEIPIDLAYYRAPERTEGHAPGPANAVYALGLLLYEMLTGTRPIQGHDPQTIAQAHLSLRLPVLSQVRSNLYMPSVERLIARATARLPEQRLHDATALGAALDEVWRELGTNTQPLAVPPAVLRPRRRAANADDPRPADLPTPVMTVAPPLQPQPVLPPDEHEFQPVDPQALRRKNVRRGIVGWIVMLALLLVVAGGSYVLASFVVDRVFAIQLPRPSLPDLGINLPGWLPGVEPREVLVVNTNDLNLREQAGTASAVVTSLPGGTRVVKLEGPVTVDNIPWVRVRVEQEGQPLEGWMSLNYLKPAE